MKKIFILQIFILFCACANSQNIQVEETVKMIDKLAIQIDKNKHLLVKEINSINGGKEVDTAEEYKIVAFYDSTKKLVKTVYEICSKVSTNKNKLVTYYLSENLMKIVNYRVKKNRKKLKITGDYYFRTDECIYRKESKGQAMHMYMIVFSTQLNIAYKARFD